MGAAMDVGYFDSDIGNIDYIIIVIRDTSDRTYVVHEDLFLITKPMVRHLFLTVCVKKYFFKLVEIQRSIFRKTNQLKLK